MVLIQQSTGNLLEVTYTKYQKKWFVLVKSWENFNENKKIFRLLNGKIISTNNKKLISFEFDKIDYNLSKFSSKTIKVAKILELPSSKIIKCSLSLLYNKIYIDEMFRCEKERLKNLNQQKEENNIIDLKVKKFKKKTFKRKKFYKKAK